MSSSNRPRGVCPSCGRELALRGDRTLSAHNQRARRRKNEPPAACDGSGQHPSDQGRLLEATP